MALNNKAKQQLKTRAHKLRPVVIVGNNGLTETVNIEIDRALTDHELIKMRINAEDRELRRALFAEIAELHGAEIVQQVGKMGVLFRVSDKGK
jgi:RNA-binding protein